MRSFSLTFSARAVQTEDYPYGLDPDAWRERLREVRQRWGERDYIEEQARAENPSADDEFVAWFVICQRFYASPGAALNLFASSARPIFGTSWRASVFRHSHPPSRPTRGDARCRAPRPGCAVGSLPAEHADRGRSRASPMRRAPSSRARARTRAPTRGPQRFCLQTSWPPPNEQQRSAIEHGETCDAAPRGCTA